MAIVVFDASFLIPLLDPKVKGIGEVDGRLLHLINTLDKQKDVIIVPTPALSETLIGAGEAAPKYLDILNKTARLRIAPFGSRAAVEAAARHREALRVGDKMEGSANWAKVKFDRQIVAIAKVEAAERIYSNDDDIRRYGKADGLQVIKLEDLEGPPEKTSDLFDIR
jgi:predicted nucleic acid-binding protein